MRHTEHWNVTSEEARSRARRIMLDACADMASDIDLAHSGFFAEIEPMLRPDEVQAFRDARDALDSAMKHITVMANLLRRG